MFLNKKYIYIYIYILPTEMNLFDGLKGLNLGAELTL